MKLINKIINYFKKVSVTIIILLSEKKRFNNLFLYLIKFAGSELYFFTTFEERSKIARKFINAQNIKKRNKFADKLDSNLINVIKKIKLYGLSKELKHFSISQKKIQKVLDHFKKKDFYDFHTPEKKYYKNFKQKPKSAYKSYDLETQLNCFPILEIILNKKICLVASNYLNCIPTLYSVNTFWTFPKKNALTTNFHRDLDDLKFITFFIYWTSAGGYEQINFTHKNSKNIKKILKSKKNKYFSNNFNDFYKQTMPGYGFDDNYMKLFGKKNITYFKGVKGKIIVADTEGLHRGKIEKLPRLATWIRFGISTGRDTAIEKKLNINKLNDENLRFIKNSDYNYVFRELLK